MNDQGLGLDDIGDILILRSKVVLTVDMLERIWAHNEAPEEGR